MTDFWKTAALVILAVILGTALSRTEKDIAVVLTGAVCCIVAATALRYLSEVLTFLQQLDRETGCTTPFLETLLKIAGVGLLTELTCLISADAGSSSLGKAMQILGNAVILSLSVPVFETFLTMIQEMLRIP